MTDTTAARESFNKALDTVTGEALGRVSRVLFPADHLSGWEADTGRAAVVQTVVHMCSRDVVRVVHEQALRPANLGDDLPWMLGSPLLHTVARALHCNLSNPEAVVDSVKEQLRCFLLCAQTGWSSTVGMSAARFPRIDAAALEKAIESRRLADAIRSVVRTYERPSHPAFSRENKT